MDVELNVCSKVDNSLLPSDAGDPESEGGKFYGVICNLIYATLHVLLIRAHAYEKAQRLDISAALRSVTRPPHPVQPPLILQPIIDLIQYQVFCERVKIELDKIMKALLSAGIPTIIRFNAVGDCGEYIVKLVTDNTTQRVGGDAMLRIDERSLSISCRFFLRCLLM
jgi:mediator of RNA polymerase II transcription subunit 17